MEAPRLIGKHHFRYSSFVDSVDLAVWLADLKQKIIVILLARQFLDCLADLLGVIVLHFLKCKHLLKGRIVTPRIVHHEPEQLTADLHQVVLPACSKINFSDLNLCH